MYIDKAVVNSYDYPWSKGKQGKTLQLENSLKVERIRLKKLLPLLEEFEETMEHYNTKITLTINIEPSKED
tara:strand:+ start:85 stop:297 length:213 start_codon:yes stop_codon:yes gene_type:complete